MMKFIILLLLPLQLLAQKISQSDLDKFIKQTVEQVKVAGASVLVAEKGKIILNKGYGFAHLGFGVPATTHTKYFIVGPNTLILAAAIMQQVEKNKLSLDDEITKHLPQYPLGGKKVTIRHLLTSTSGIPDYHYLGDPFDGQAYQPKTLDEVIALFAGKPFLIEPGSKFDWSISNFALLTAILETISGQRYQDYLNDHFIKPLSLQHTEYLDPIKSIPNFAYGYHFLDTSFSPATSSLFRYDPSLRLVSTAGDIYKIWSGIRENKIISQQNFHLMTSREEAKKNNAGDFGYTIRLGKEDDVEAIGLFGALAGYSSFLSYYPEKDITIIVLSNTSGQKAREIGRRIARNMLDLKPLPVTEIPKKLIADLPIPDNEISAITGTYVVYRKIIGNSSSTTYNTYKRTLRVFVENDHLVMQQFGELPQPLLKQEDGSYRFKSAANTVISFKMDSTTAVISITNPGFVSSGNRVGKADAKIFHDVAFENLK